MTAVEAVALGALAGSGSGNLDIHVAAPPWLQTRHELPCRDEDPEAFHPWTYGSACQKQIDAMKAVCLQCPVRAMCLEWALPQADLDGIVAATTPAERRRERARRARCQ
jgi:WhiB family redox-sensing transcriptional regulator